jgi:hypothetical protein
MEPEGRRQLLLATVVVLLAAGLYLAWSFTTTPAAPPAAPGSPVAATGTRSSPSNGRGSAGPEAPDVRLSQLSVDRPKPGGPDRNLFRFKTKARSLPPAPASAGPRSGAVVAPVAPAGPPPITLKFIGIVERREKSERIAVLRDTVGHVFYGGEGEVVEGRYRIVRIGAESIELAYLDGQGRQTIRLTGS